MKYVNAFFIGMFCFFLMGNPAFSKDLPPIFKRYTSLVRIDPPLSPYRSSVGEEIRDRLQINTSIDFRIAVYEDEFTGICNLRDLSLTATVEEQWAFLPDKNKWIEIGFGETAGTAMIDFNLLNELIEQNNHLVVYHIHLRDYLDKARAASQVRIPETWLVVPSFSDVALMVFFTSRFHKIHGDGAIDWKICSPLGVTEYSLSWEGIEHFKTIRHNAFLLTYFSPGQSNGIGGQAVSVFDLAATHKADQLIKWVNAQGKSFIHVTFKPYTEPARVASSF